jgi:hypothetical protein
MSSPRTVQASAIPFARTVTQLDARVPEAGCG